MIAVKQPTAKSVNQLKLRMLTIAAACAKLNPAKSMPGSDESPKSTGFFMPDNQILPIFDARGWDLGFSQRATVDEAKAARHLDPTLLRFSFQGAFKMPGSKRSPRDFSKMFERLTLDQKVQILEHLERILFAGRSAIPHTEPNKVIDLAAIRTQRFSTGVQ